jgi:preprotein translocase subunit YajC
LEFKEIKLISNAYAQAAGATTGGWAGFSTQIFPIVIMFAIFYFMIIRPQMRRTKEHKAMLENLQKGDEVIAAGLLGKINKMGDSFISLEIADNVTIAVQKNSVSQLLPKGTIKTAQ